MHREHIYCAGSTAAIQYAEAALRTSGFSVIREPSWNTKHLLLDVPSFRDNQTLRSGGNVDTLLNSLPKDIVIWGGNLTDQITENYKTVDLLKDELYLAKNAAITADCALQIAAPLLTGTWQDSPSLVIGWGRIGKCLSRMLKALGTDVTVAARSPAVRAALVSLDYPATDPSTMHGDAEKYRIVFNTAPVPVILEEDAENWKHCIKIDLASRKGIAGEDVVWARGLPGIYAPESSGRLIAETVIRLWKEKKV